MKRGWIKLYRKLSDNKLWTSEPFTRGQAWADLLLLANHKEDFFYVRGNRVVVERGQVGWSQLGLSKRWSWSRGKVKRFLNELEIDQQIVQQNNFVSSVITIINYEEYQGDGQQTVQQTDSERTADGQQTDINKKIKNDNNGKNAKKEDLKDIFPFEEIISHLNEILEASYKHKTEGHRRLIKARWAEGYRLEDFKKVHITKFNEWRNTDLAAYLRPETLYSNKFASYLNQKSGQSRVSDKVAKSAGAVQRFIERGEKDEQIS